MDKINKVIVKGLGQRLKEENGWAEKEPVKKTESEKEYYKKVFSNKKQEDFYDVHKIWSLFNYHSKMICKKDFLIDEQNIDFIKLLCFYFSKDERFLQYSNKSKYVSTLNNLDFDKGLLIFGSIGFGKSLIMKIFKNISIPGNRFYYHEANDIVMEYSKDGYEGLENFLKSNAYYDDIGTEEKASHYEKGKEIFKTIIETRYNQFLNKGYKTHFTSNLNPDELKERYGERVRSRLNEMFNIIVVNGEDRRK